MKCIAVSLMLLITGSLMANARPGDDTGLLTTTEWLAQHLQDENLIVLHAHWTRGNYIKSHIPGARFLWIWGLAKNTPDLSTELPPTEEAAALLEEAGINNNSRVIVYFEGQNLTMSARMMLTLTYLGLGDRISLLNGGFDAWKSEGRAVTDELPAVKPGTFTPQLHPEVFTDAPWLLEHLSDPSVTIIDARTRQFFDGTSGGANAGHLPRAVSIPYSSVADSTNRILDADALRILFSKSGVPPGNTLVTYCHVGQQASLVAFAAGTVGFDVRVYDGSFEDWNNRGLPIEKPAETK